jgi:hypothetical protein
MKDPLAICSILLIPLALSACAEKPWEAVGKGSVLIPKAQVLPGGHCESSAMLNALSNQGYPVTEAMITGAGGALGFNFEKGTFPFITARNADMRERFYEAAGIGFHKKIPEAGGDYGWSEIRSLLEQGRPVVLRVDMRYLPYLYGGKHGPAHTSFGWHMVTLFAIDGDSGTALVSDTGYAQLQKIKLSDLHKARTSKTKVYPPQAEYSWADPAPQGYAVDWGRLMRSSVSALAENYEKGSLTNLEAFPSDLESFESWCKQGFLYPAVLEYMAGNIEDFGTGGASFRVLYREFLAQAVAANAPSSGGFEYPKALARIDECIASWHELSASFRIVSKTIKKMGKEERAAAYAGFAKTARTLLEREKAFYTEMKKYDSGE